MNIIINCVFGGSCLWAFLMIIYPALCEKMAVSLAKFSGSDFDEAVTSRKKYRRTIRIIGVVLLILLLPTWLICALLIGLHNAGMN